jgi:Zn ribbon nucleic-acid-binding protein
VLGLSRSEGQMTTKKKIKISACCYELISLTRWERADGEGRVDTYSCSNCGQHLYIEGHPQDLTTKLRKEQQ